VSEQIRVVRHGSSECRVHIGTGLLERLPELTSELGDRFLLASEYAFSLLRDRLWSALAAFGEPILVPDGETAKTLNTVDAIVTALLERGARRDSAAIIIGGGVTGDTAGFATAIYLRGIRVVHVPTTFLAQCDSSIGGKVAVNHKLGKNLIGAFHPPAAVISDVGVLSSLPRREILSGVYEALKSGVIGDPSLFELCVRSRDAILARDAYALVEVVSRSVEVKSRIVEMDEREHDQRRLLNYGHTIAHGLESAMRYEGLSHGEAVAWGMLAANSVARARGWIPESLEQRLRAAILAYRPAPIPWDVDRQEILAGIRHDKKFTSSSMVMILPREIGRCEITSVSGEEIDEAVDAMIGASARYVEGSP
jgi:3-dehydroquinate synthase